MDSEQQIRPSVYAPNLHLFSYHLWRGLTGESDSLAPNPKHLWKRGDEILKELGFAERLDIDGYPDDRKETEGAQVNLYRQNCLELTGKLPDSDLKIAGRVRTHRLYDSYSLTVNFRRPEQENGEKTADVPISFWRDLNTNEEIFLPDFVDSSLGQTLLLTAFLPQSEIEKTAENLEVFACQILKQLIPSRKKRPPLERVGELFGSPIFEFGGEILDANLHGEAIAHPHVLILLFREELPSEKFVDAYRQFINLFYYRNKVTSAYRETRTLYRKNYEAYIELEKRVKSFRGLLREKTKSLQLDEAELEALKTVLKQLVELDLEYGRLLRNYKHCRNTIAINTNNYQVTLEAIFNTLKEGEYEVKREELDFFRELSDRTSPYFQNRIANELNYFVEGSNLSDKAIASIRGIVEIEQAQRDRRLQTQNQQLQDQIQIVGVGIAVGAIVASTVGLIFEEPMTFPLQENRGEILHPFAIALLISLGFAIVAAGGMKFIIWLIKKKPSF